MSTRKKGPGWIRASDGEIRWHFGVWLDLQEDSLRSLARLWQVNPTFVVRCARYEKRIPEARFKGITSATYAQYLKSFDFFRQEFFANRSEQQRLLEIIGVQK